MASLSQKYIEVCVFKFEANAPRYLILHRSAKESVYPGVWQYITGSIEDKETAVEAALRELGEETGLTPVSMWVVPYVNSFYDQRRDTISINPVFAVEVASGSEPAISEEHQEFVWLDFEDAIARLVWPGQHAALRIVHEFIIKGKDAMRHSRII